ncbi:MAG: hydroxyisourate hydrolase [Verrucomicrobiota bacterium]
MSGKLSTHILDNTHGKPAPGVAIQLFRKTADDWTLIGEFETNADGRTDSPLLKDAALETAAYRLVFHIGDYFRQTKVELSEPPFLDQVAIEVNLTSGENYHVPLLATPWSYSTYRGS